MSRTVILGAGIAGLTAAFRRPASMPGSEITVLEAAPRVGGSIRTLREDGFVLEAGPNTLRTSEAAERLLADLDLAGETLVADGHAPRYIVRGGRARAIKSGPAGLFTSALSWGAKLRVLAEPLRPKRDDALEDESVHDFFSRRFGPEVARYAAGPIVSGVYADDPRTLSLRSAFPKLWEAEARGGSVIRGFLKKEPGAPKKPRFHPRTLSFRQGLATLAERLAERLRKDGVTITTGAAVEAVDGPVGGGARFTLRLSDGRLLEADRVVSTLAASEVARLFGPRLPRSRAKLAALEASPLAVALLGFQSDPAHAPVGFGTLIPRGEGFEALGVLYLSSLFPERVPRGIALTTVFLGGALAPALVKQPDDDLLGLAEREVRRLHPRLADRVLAKLVKWEASIPRLPLGHHETLAALHADLAEINGGAPPALVVTGPWRDGVSMGDRITRGEEVGRSL